MDERRLEQLERETTPGDLGRDRREMLAEIRRLQEIISSARAYIAAVDAYAASDGSDAQMPAGEGEMMSATFICDYCGSEADDNDVG